MSKKAQELFDRMKSPEEPRAGVLAPVREGVRTLAPGLDLKTMAAEIGAELKSMGAHGAHELAAALFNGSAFVLYPRTGADENRIQGPEPERGHEPPQQERGGMEM